ncbi:hypothetical protein IV102_01200 [bacterium]|nr:hypothetical protein [bacterium]
MKGSVAHLVRQGLTVYLRPYCYSTGVVAELACLVLVLQRADFLQLVGDSDRVLQSLQDTAVGRSLTLFGRRGRRASSIPATWDLILED